jgi:poly(3-hydroxybutyrate) depolymerase
LHGAAVLKKRGNKEKKEAKKKKKQAPRLWIRDSIIRIYFATWQPLGPSPSSVSSRRFVVLVCLIRAPFVSNPQRLGYPMSPLIRLRLGLLLPCLGLTVAQSLTPINFNFTGVLPIKYKGEHRTYHLLSPASYNVAEQKEYPVLLIYHGYTACAEGFALETTLTQAAPARGFFAIFMDGVQTPGSTQPCKERSWNAGTCCGEANENSVDDIAYSEAVLKHAREHGFKISTEKVFVVGTSNGGSMALRAGCGLKHVAGVVADISSFETRNGSQCAVNCKNGGDGFEYCDWDHLGTEHKECTISEWTSLPKVYDCNLKEQPVPILIFNGRLDPFSLIGGQVSKPTTKGAGVITSFPPMLFAYDYFRKMYDCKSDEFTSYSNGTAGNETGCISWKGCSANVTYCLCEYSYCMPKLSSFPLYINNFYSLCLS